MFKPVVVCAALLFVVASADEDTVVRKSVVDCINKDILAANTESWKLPEADIKIFTNIIDKEIMKEPLCKKTLQEQMKIIDEIHEATKKELPHVDQKTIDKMIDLLKIKGKHCTELVKKH
ncbi:uncharacterized protein LOC100903829 [Galendromus occidentalis]|uniref:Uncharacterized protein LOC100903829 n=1 Tax=Galendromus occidentalis TaxID=34638 RepID=A0AAJ6VX65_9ACAR|nr:uncharacterized protein LOC100903829 [Galendromus occidentalis]